MKTLSVRTHKTEELVDITAEVAGAVCDAKISNGICVVFIPHTTAAVTINENADPDVCSDMINGIAHLGFNGVSFSHSEGNSPAHIKSSLVGCSETIIIENGQLVLGIWQGIYLCEFDGPRTRKVMVHIQ